MNNKYKLIFLAIGSALLTGCAIQSSHDKADTVDVRVLAMNDFHGALKAPGPNKPGGIEQMSTLIKKLKKEQRDCSPP
ncbi:hypothetical protein [Photorhabdus namnaonensis]|uniref:5'-nucleotidase n=1 Tax=Photorhabdus namnaonensis TaxID=1851568 RepID=A0A1B8YH83_9GAMM|nr:hypothetical protein [Photorhabdus namnaonensis]OCA54437.1 hypothetical protein Phpb_02881 [Photorhabdus namnaonensis]